MSLPVRMTERWRKKVWEFLGITSLGGILTAILTWPFVARLSVFYQDSGDYPTNGWILWYNQWAIKTGRIFHQTDYFNATQFHPFPYSLAYADHLFLPSLIFSPLYWLTHQFIFSVNFFAFLTLILSFLSSYYVIHYFVPNKPASLLGAAIYTFNPQTLFVFPDYLNLMNKYFLPPTFLFAYCYFKNPGWKNAMFFSLFFTLNALSSIYFLVLASIFLPLFFLPFLIQKLVQKNYNYFLSFFKYSLLGILFLPLLLYFNSPYLSFTKKEGIVRNLDLQSFYSARLIDWFLPDPDSLLYHRLAEKVQRIKAVKSSFPNADHVLFLNVIPWLLAGIGIFMGIKILRRNQRDTSLSLFFCSWMIILCVSFILALGPYFLGWNHNYGSIKLPFYYLYKFSPILDGMRTPTRFQYVFYLPFSVFAAYGAASLFDHKKKASFSVFMVLLALLILENYTVKSYASTSSILMELTDSKKRQLSFLSGETTFHLPVFWPDLFKNSIYLNWSTQTGESTLNGYSGYIPEDWKALVKGMDDDLNEDAIKQLKALGIRFIILHKDLMKERYKALLEKHGSLYKELAFYEDDKNLILKLRDEVLPIQKCSFYNDIAQEGFAFFAIDGLPSYFQATLRNTKDCYLCSAGKDRYWPVTLTLSNERYPSFLRLPILILPHQKISAVGFIRRIKTEWNTVNDAQIKLTQPLSP